MPKSDSYSPPTQGIDLWSMDAHHHSIVVAHGCNKQSLEAKSAWEVSPSDIDGVRGRSFNLVCSTAANSDLSVWQHRDQLLQGKQARNSSSCYCFNEFYLFSCLEFSSDPQFSFF